MSLVKHRFCISDRGFLKASLVADLQPFGDGTDAGWVERDDAFVTFDQEYGDITGTLQGPLSADQYGGFWDTAVGSMESSTFGPEAGFGFEIADNFDQKVVIVKTARGSALAQKWISPFSKGGTGGGFYDLLLGDISDAMQSVKSITGLKGKVSARELCGIVWW
jgi:hypothetical protein